MSLIKHNSKYSNILKNISKYSNVHFIQTTGLKMIANAQDKDYILTDTSLKLQEMEIEGG